MHATREFTLSFCDQTGTTQTVTVKRGADVPSDLTEPTIAALRSAGLIVAKIAKKKES